MLLATLVVVGFIACSPEASRRRDGGPGADIGNHGPSLYVPATPPPLPGG
jgi:hypothetical protein